MISEIFIDFERKKWSPPPPPGHDHVLEGRRSQGGLTPNSLEFDLL